jgi:hypothetical protein
MAVLGSAAVWFFGLTMLFAVGIYAIGMNKPTCIHANGADFGTATGAFGDAYTLSWTTFSTVVCLSLAEVFASRGAMC